MNAAQEQFLQTIRDLFTVPDRRARGGKPVGARPGRRQKRPTKSAPRGTKGAPRRRRLVTRPR
jgi:hypothetical protein